MVPLGFFRKKQEKFLQLLAVSILSLAVLLWLQGYFFIWDYGKFDGSELNFEKYNMYGIFEIIIWMTFLFLFLRFHKKIIHYTHKIVLVCLVALLATTTSAYMIFLNGSQDAWYNKYSISNDNFYKYSRDKNVILLVLDASRGDVFEEILETLTSDEKSLFEGFTFFKNTTGTFSQTNPAMTGILTSIVYDYKEPQQKAYKEMFLSDFSVPYQLRKHGFISDMYPYSVASVYLSPRICDNLREIGQSKNSTQEVKKDLKKLMIVSKFNFSPHYVKMYFFDSAEIYAEVSSTEEVVQKSDKKVDKKEINLLKKYKDLSEVIDDPQLSSEFISHLRSSREIVQNLASELTFGAEPVFKYLHFHGAHHPFMHDEQYVGKKQFQTIEAYRKQLKGSIIYTVGALIESLKKEGVYDKTMLIVIGDHGLVVSGKGQNLDFTKNEHALVQAALRPLMLIKPFNASLQPLKVSSAPVSLFDIPQTVFDAVAIKVKTKGRSVFDVKENEKRIRYSYGAYVTSDAIFLDKAAGFSIDGDVKDLHAWVTQSYFHLKEGEKKLGVYDLKMHLNNLNIFLFKYLKKRLAK